MHHQGTTWLYLAGLVVLASCGLSVCTAADADKTKVPRPLPPEIVKAWRDAGAEAGWMKDVPPQRSGGYEFWRQWRDKVEIGALPAFRFHPENPDVLARLPDPGVDFGLDFHCSPVTGPWLKNMAGLKSLRSLNVGGSQSLTDQ